MSQISTKDQVMQTQVTFFGLVCKWQVKPCQVFYLDAAVQLQIPELLCQDFSSSDLTSTYIYKHPALQTNDLQREPHLSGSEN